ncbi:MAG: hypothetical protein ACI3YC_03905 [Alloprevotella sp.]
MSKGFDFEKVGKRLPYAVPDGFFDQLESQVFAATTENEAPRNEKERKKSRFTIRRPRLLWTLSSVAAAAAVLLTLLVLPPKTTADSGLADIENAFDNLSAADKDFLEEIQEEDIFLNDNYFNEDL